MTFGHWLAMQAGRDEWVGALGAAVAADAGFPLGGGPDDARVHLADMAAEPDSFEQLDDAEREWLGMVARAA